MADTSETGPNNEPATFLRWVLQHQSREAATRQSLLLCGEADMLCSRRDCPAVLVPQAATNG